MVFTPSKLFPTQTFPYFPETQQSYEWEIKSFLSLISDISLKEPSKHNTGQNSWTKSSTYTVKDRLCSAHCHFKRIKPKISGEALTVLTFEHRSLIWELCNISWTWQFNSSSISEPVASAHCSMNWKEQKKRNWHGFTVMRLWTPKGMEQHTVLALFRMISRS